MPITFIIDGYLYLGSRFDAADYNALCGLGITAIVNVTLDEPNHFADIEGIDYLHCPVEDHPEARIEAYFDVCSAFIENMRAQGRATLIHCRGGISRSPTIVIAYLMKHRTLAFADAFNLVARSRRIAPNEAFLKKLKALC